MMKEFMDSDRLNYLVWRYLLEGNYRETAAKFQKEWHVHEPHRHFDFARHVKSRALVSVINKGLCYSSLEREHVRKTTSPNAPAAAHEALQDGVFGPLVTQPPHKVEDGDDTETEADASRKRQMDNQRPHHHQMNGSPAKRPRLSNGYENGVDSTPTPMELDSTSGQNQATENNNHAYPSPMEGEQPPTPQTNGPDKGTQVEKVEDLAAETTYLRLTSEDGQESRAASPSEYSPILLRCEWNPRDPSMLAAAGTDALARLWTIPRPTNREAGDPVPNHVDGADFPFLSLVEDNGPGGTLVSQIAWNSLGTAIAVASDHNGEASVQVWSKARSHLGRFDVPEPPIIKLCWNPTDTALLAISPEKGGALITIYQPTGGARYTYRKDDHDLVSWPLDAVWTSDSDFLLCGGDLLLSLRCSDSGIIVVKKFETRSDDTFSQIQFDWRSRLAAISSEKGHLDLWDDSGRRQTISAHSGLITSMQWQPLPEGAPTPEDERLIATAGDDCGIFVWNARKPDSKPVAFMTMNSPVLSMAFTPDGAYIAGAALDRILVFKVGDYAMPRASWRRMSHTGWLSPKTNSESDVDDEHCLGWDCDGKRLVYGTNGRLAVIHFRR